MNAPHLPNGDHREASDRCRGELLRHGKWRLVVCRGNWQWILQRHTRAGSPDGGRWEARHYCRTCGAQIRLWTVATGDDGAALIALLPEHIRFLQGRT